jgi:hypothetical protein
MGVSYWEIGARDRAYALTQAGLELVQQGVSEGLLAKESLDVPKGNLAAMSRALGKASADQQSESNEDETRLVRKNRTQRAGASSQGRRQSQVADGRSRSEGTRRR